MSKPTLCVDFDGVLHSYTSRWTGAGVVSDPPVEGAIDFLREAVKHFKVSIYSSRSSDPAGIAAMQSWLRGFVAHDRDGQDMGFLDLIEYPTHKPAAFLTIDDRAYLFEGTFPKPESLLSFKPWNKRDK